jgi:hypothetical protein
MGGIPTNHFDLTLPAINGGGSWFNEGACPMNTPTHSVEVPFPQAFTGPEPRPFPSAPRYGKFLASSNRQSDREVGMRPPKRSYAAYHQCAHEQSDTLVLLPVGTIYHGTQRNTIRLSVCTRTRTNILQGVPNVKQSSMARGFSACGRRAFHPPLGKTGAESPFSVRTPDGQKDDAVDGRITSSITAATPSSALLNVT